MTTQNASSHCQMSHEVKNHLQLRSTALEGIFFNILTPLWYLLPQDKLYSPLLSCFSCVQLFVTPRNYNPLAPLSMEFFRQEYWSGLPCPPPGDLPGPGIEPVSLTSPALAGGCFCFVFLPLVPPGKPVFPTDYTFFYPSLSDSLSFKVTFSQSEMLIWSLIKQML